MGEKKRRAKQSKRDPIGRLVLAAMAAARDTGRQDLRELADTLAREASEPPQRRPRWWLVAAWSDHVAISGPMPLGELVRPVWSRAEATKSAASILGVDMSELDTELCGMCVGVQVIDLRPWVLRGDGDPPRWWAAEAMWRSGGVRYVSTLGTFASASESDGVDVPAVDATMIVSGGIDLRDLVYLDWPAAERAAAASRDIGDGDER